MATVPVARSTETLQALPGQRQQVQRQESGLGEGLQSLGQGLQQFAKGRQIYLDKVDEATVADLDSAFANDVRQIERGFTSAQGKNAVDIAADTQKAWNETRASYLSRANNPAQATMLNQVLDRRGARWADQYDSHLTRQADVWQDQAFTSRMATMSVDMASAPVGSIERADASVALYDAIDQYGARKGWDEETFKAQRQSYFGEVNKNTVNALIEAGDPKGAEEFFESVRSGLPTEVETALAGRVREVVTAADARGFARSQNFSSDPTAPGADGPVAVTVDNLWTAQKTQESGNRQFDRNGQLIRSPVGAFGIAQLMPDTATDIARAMGDPSLAARARTDPAVNERMGKWYMGQQMAKYGLPSLALAAYNAGPGRVDQWLVTIGDPRKGDMTEAQWAERIPFRETRGYVANIMARSGASSSGGGAAMSLAPESEIRARARAAAGDDPRRQDAFEAAAMAEYRNHTSATTEARNTARDMVQDWLPLGASPASSWTEIAQAHPREWNALDPEYRNQIRGQFEARDRAAQGSGEAETDPAVYNALLTMRMTNPQRFAQDVDINTVEGLSDTDRRSLFKEWLEIKTNPNTPANSPQQTALRQALPEIRRQATAAGIDPKTDDGLKELNGLTTFVSREIQDFVRINDRIPTSAEVLSINARGLRELQGARTGLFGWGGAETRRNFEVIVPAAAQATILSEFRAAAPGVPISPDDVRSLYMQGLANGRFKE